MQHHRHHPRRRALLALALTAAATVSVAAVSVGPASAVSQPPKPYTANSPDGPLLYDVRNNEIHMLDADGTDTLVYQGDACMVIHDLTTSPGSAQIAFDADDNTDAQGCSGTATHGVYTMTTSGSGLTRLQATSGSNVQTSWSPDGSQIAVADSGHVSLDRTDGSAVTPLATDNAVYGGLDWSPDGSRIAYESYLGSTSAGALRYALKVVNTDGTGQTTLLADTSTRLSNGTYPSGRAIWSSDDELVLAGSAAQPSTSTAGTCTLVGLTVSTGALRQLASTPAGTSCAGYAHYQHVLQRSPDGATIAFVLRTVNGSAQSQFGTLETVPAAGGTVTVLPNVVADQVAWDRIVYGTPPRRGRR